MFVSVPGRAHTIAMGVEWGSACTQDRSSPQMSIQRPPSSQHLRATLLLPLSSVKLPCLQGQFAQGFPHCLCFWGHLQGLQEGCSPGEEAKCRSEAESDREKLGGKREEQRPQYLPFLSRVFLGSQGPMSCRSLRGHCRCVP